MKYWKKIHLDYEEEIRNTSLELLKKHSDIFDRTKFKGSFIPVPIEFITHNSFLDMAFSKYNKKCIGGGIYIMWNNGDAIPHIDDSEELARVNIPLCNTLETHTIFYENADTTPLILPTGAKYRIVTNTDYREVDRVCVDSPTILRISEPHTIVMNEEKIPRVTLSVRLSPDIVDLLE